MRDFSAFNSACDCRHLEFDDVTQLHLYVYSIITEIIVLGLNANPYHDHLKRSTHFGLNCEKNPLFFSAYFNFSMHFENT